MGLQSIRRYLAEGSWWWETIRVQWGQPAVFRFTNDGLVGQSQCRDWCALTDTVPDPHNLKDAKWLLWGTRR